MNLLLRKGFLVVVAVAGVGCGAVERSVITSRAAQGVALLSDPGNELQPVTGRVYSFKFGWYRNLVLVSGDEIAVVDPMNAEAAALLRDELAKHFGGKRLTLVVYSHSHHDHIRGAAELAPLARGGSRIVGHANIVRELDLAQDDDGVTRPTELVNGDTSLTWAGLRIELLYLPRSHSDSYLAVWLPEERVLYAPDLVGKRGGMALDNDQFLPGVLRGQERLLQLDPAVVVPGHFAICTRADLQAAHDRLAGMRAIVREELRKQPGYDVTKWDPAAMVQIKERLVERYGDYPTFEEASLTNTYYLVLGYVGGF